MENPHVRVGDEQAIHRQNPLPTFFIIAGRLSHSGFGNESKVYTD